MYWMNFLWKKIKLPVLKIFFLTKNILWIFYIVEVFINNSVNNFSQESGKLYYVLFMQIAMKIIIGR